MDKLLVNAEVTDLYAEDYEYLQDTIDKEFAKTFRQVILNKYIPAIINGFDVEISTLDHTKIRLYHNTSTGIGAFVTSAGLVAESIIEDRLISMSSLTPGTKNYIYAYYYTIEGSYDYTNEVVLENVKSSIDYSNYNKIYNRRLDKYGVTALTATQYSILTSTGNYVLLGSVITSTGGVLTTLDLSKRVYSKTFLGTESVELEALTPDFFLPQSMVENSTTINDEFYATPEDLQDDLNSIRTQIRNMKQTYLWDDSVPATGLEGISTSLDRLHKTGIAVDYGDQFAYELTSSGMAIHIKTGRFLFKERLVTSAEERYFSFTPLNTYQIGDYAHNIDSEFSPYLTSNWSFKLKHPHVRNCIITSNSVDPHTYSEGYDYIINASTGIIIDGGHEIQYEKVRCYYEYGTARCDLIVSTTSTGILALVEGTEVSDGTAEPPILPDNYFIIYSIFRPYFSENVLNNYIISDKIEMLHAREIREIDATIKDTYLLFDSSTGLIDDYRGWAVQKLSITSTGYGITKVVESAIGKIWELSEQSIAYNMNVGCYGNGKFIVLSNNSATMSISSTLGKTWEATSSPTAGDWTGIAYGGGLYVAVGGFDMSHPRVSIVSTDGITWTPGTQVLYHTRSLAYGNGRFVTVSDNDTTNCAQISYNGINWFDQALPRSYWHTVIYENNIFVAIGLCLGEPTKDIIATSPDGITWTVRYQAPAPYSFWLLNIVFGNNKFYITGIDWTLYPTEAAFFKLESTDGINWTRSPGLSNVTLNGITYSGALVTCKTFEGGFFIGIITDQKYVGLSRDYVNWVAYPTDRALDQFLSGNHAVIGLATDDPSPGNTQRSLETNWGLGDDGLSYVNPNLDIQSIIYTQENDELWLYVKTSTATVSLTLKYESIPGTNIIDKTVTATLPALSSESDIPCLFLITKGFKEGYHKIKISTSTGGVTIKNIIIDKLSEYYRKDGIYVNKDITYFGSASKIYVCGVTEATSPSTGTIVTPGGLGIAKDTFVGKIITLDDTDSTTATTGSIITAGGVGVEKSIVTDKKLVILDSTESSSITTGSLVSAGGVSAKGTIYVGGAATFQDSTESITSNTGATVTLGGVGAAKSIIATGPIIDSTGVLSNFILPTADTSSIDTDSWLWFKSLLNKSVKAGRVFTTNISYTYALAYTNSNAYYGGVLAPNGDIHFVPCYATVGQKINSSGTPSTYSLAYTITDAYAGGVLAPNGDIHFVPYNASVGQKINSSGGASTYSLAYTIASAYWGGVLAPDGTTYFVPYNAEVGQKISNGVASTYSLTYTKTSAYIGGVLAPNGDIHFVPSSAEVGQKIDVTTGNPSTYSLAYTIASAYNGGVLDSNGNIHFIPDSASRGQLLDPSVDPPSITTYSLIYTLASAYYGGVLAPNGDIHFVPYSAHVGQKYNITTGAPSTYSLIYTVAGAYAGGVLAPNGDIYFVPSSAHVGQNLAPLCDRDFNIGVCCHAFYNKY